MSERYRYDEEVQQTLRPDHPDIRVGFILIDQFTLAPVAGLVDSLRFAADQSFRSEQLYCQWDWMTCHDQPVVASSGISITPTKTLDFSAGYDYWVVAGGLLTHTRHSPSWLLEGLVGLQERHVPIVSLCSGSFVLGQAGLLDGRDCAVHFSIRDEFEVRFPKATCLADTDYVEDDGIFTCPGGTALGLAADLIARHCGAIRAQKGLKYLLVDDNDIRAEHGENGDRDPHIYQNAVVDKAIAYMRQNLASPIPVAELARVVGTNPRQLHRAFTANTNESPGRYWRALRLEEARRMLVETSKQVTTVAVECGFSDASHLILQFRQSYGETPRSYRLRRRQVDRLASTVVSPCDPGPGESGFDVVTP